MKTMSQAAAEEFVGTLVRQSKVLEAIYHEGFHQGQIVALNAVAQKITSDVEKNDWSEEVKQALLDCSRFISAVASQGTITQAPPASDDAQQTGGNSGHEENRQGQEKGSQQEI